MSMTKLTILCCNIQKV